MLWHDRQIQLKEPPEPLKHPLFDSADTKIADSSNEPLIRHCRAVFMAWSKAHQERRWWKWQELMGCNWLVEQPDASFVNSEKALHCGRAHGPSPELPASMSLPPPWASGDTAVRRHCPAPLAAFPQLVIGPPLLPLKRLTEAQFPL